MMHTYTDSIKLQETGRAEKEHTYVEVSSTISALDADATQQLDHGPTRPKSNTLLEKIDHWWLWEVTALTIACLSLVAIAVLLWIFDGERVPPWRIETTAFNRKIDTTITINAIISIFSTILKSTIMVPIAAAISQLKWLWFCGGEQNLADIQLFDAASKGPLGAVILLWTLRGRRIVCLGAVIIVIMLGMDFASQSIVAYPLKQIAIDYDSTAFSQFCDPVPYVKQVLAPGAFAGNNMPETTADIRNILTASAFNVNTSTLLDPPCSTGNCTWEHNFATLAVCSECRELTTADFNKTCASTDVSLSTSPFDPTSYCNYTWPGTINGMNTAYTPDIMKMTGKPFVDDYGINDDPRAYYFLSTTGASSPLFHSFKRPLLVVSVMHGNWSGYGSLNGATGNQCGLKICVQKYNASMQNNRYREVLLDIFEDPSADYPDYSNEANYTLTPPSEFMRGLPPNAQREFTITSSAIHAIRSFVQEAYNGREPLWDGQIPRESTDPSSVQYRLAQSVSNLFDLTNPRTSDYRGIKNLAEKFTWLAANMTNSIRMHNIRSKITTLDNPNGRCQVMENFVHVRVRWAWLALPVLELVLTILFLLLTVQESARHKEMGILWKGSALAPFYYPLTKDGREKVGQAENPRQMENVASEMKVEWVKTEHGLRLVHR